MRSWLKAGLIGGALLALFTALSWASLFLPPVPQSVLSCCACVVFLILYPAVGVLAGTWLTPPRTAGAGAKEGALAGLVAGILDSVATLVVAGIALLLGASEKYLAQIPPEFMPLIEDSGAMVLLSPVGLLAVTVCSVPIFLMLAVGCAALGGLVYASISGKQH